MEIFELQKHFFQQIKEQLKPNVSLVEEVADLLGISTDSAYRRIRGEKPISMEEQKKLCNHFHISIDGIMNIESNGLVFYGSYVDAINFDFKQYMVDFLNDCKQINSATKKLIYYDAKDVPLFHHYQFPGLASFKFFFWMRTVLSYPEYNKIFYEDVKLEPVLNDLGLEIIRTYNKIPSIEIWTYETINSTLRQIEYYKECSIFKKKDSVMELYNQVEAMVNHIKDQAECGKKYFIGEKPPAGESNFKLFFNEVNTGHNTIFVETDNIETVFLNHGVLNYMTTRDEKFCKYTKSTLENIMKKSSLISSVSEKERNRFFKILLDKIDRLKGDLEKTSF